MSFKEDKSFVTAYPTICLYSNNKILALVIATPQRASTHSLSLCVSVVDQSDWRAPLQAVNTVVSLMLYFCCCCWTSWTLLTFKLTTGCKQSMWQVKIWCIITHTHTQSCSWLNSHVSQLLALTIKIDNELMRSSD